MHDMNVCQQEVVFHSVVSGSVEVETAKTEVWGMAVPLNLFFVRAGKRGHKIYTL